MGTYCEVKNNKTNKAKFKSLYNKHRKIDNHQFVDDFGHINSMSDTWDSGHVKVGVGKRMFYTKEFRRELKKKFKCKFE